MPDTKGVSGFMIGIKDLPECERPREKMFKYGPSGLTNNELLALIISNGTKKESAMALAGRVLSMESEGLRWILNCQPEEFKKINGIGDATACRICAAVEFGRRMAALPQNRRVKLDQAVTAAEYFMEDMRHLHSEILSVAMINSKGEIIGKETVAKGGLYYANTQPREIFANAVRKGAYGIIIAHNHPSGDPTPSTDDLSITEQIRAAGQLLGIRLIDHIIIGDGVYISLREQGAIPQ